MIKSKKQMFIVIGAFIMILLLGTTTYAFFNYTRTGSSNVIKVGKISFSSEQTTITLDNVFPISSEDVATDTDNVGVATIHITGDTTYSDGIEYLVTATDIHRSIGSGVNKKDIPISLDISVSATENKTMGDSDLQYFDNRGGDTSIYRILSNRIKSHEQKLFVGYIASGATGVDGIINIKAYLDADKIAVSDTYYETNSQYVVNPNMTQDELNACVTYLTSLGLNNYLISGESLESFCNGTGTISGDGFQYSLDQGWFVERDLKGLEELNVILKRNAYYGTTSEWVDGRVVLTTEEWNSFNSNGLSFKIKVEANEGIWVDQPANAMNEFKSNMFGDFSDEQKIKEIRFVSMNENEMHQRYESATYKSDLTYNSEGEVLTWLETNNEDSEKYTMYVVSDGVTYLTTGAYLFQHYGYSYAEKIIFENVDTSRVTDMNHMFNYMYNLKELDIRSFNTSNVTNLNYFISKCDKLESVNMEGLDLRKAQNMSFMFSGNPVLTTLNIDGIETRDVRQMNSMFESTRNLEYINLEGLGGDNLVNASWMFSGSDVTKNINMKNFNFGQVTSLNYLFGGLTALETVDLSGVKMNNVTNTNTMFSGDSSLTTIYVSSNWNVDNVTSSSSMFNGCTSIVGGNGTTYDENTIDKTYARIDGIDGLDGYLTLKTN